MQRYAFLLYLSLFNAVTAILGGLGLTTGVLTPPAEYIDGTIFGNYVAPGLILMLVVGGSALYASILLLRNRKYGRDVAGAAGLIMVGWIIGEVAIIDVVSWLQIIFFLSGFAVFEFAFPGSDDLNKLLREKHVLRKAAK